MMPMHRALLSVYRRLAVAYGGGHQGRMAARCVVRARIALARSPP